MRFDRILTCCVSIIIALSNSLTLTICLWTGWQIRKVSVPLDFPRRL